MIPYDEFSMFRDNATEVGLAFDAEPVVRRTSAELEDGRHLSALVWGEGDPDMVLIHGGAQNAHTWDTVALALGRPLVAIDLPGHGHSGPPKAGAANVEQNSIDVAAAIRILAPGVPAIVGMSLGGLTSMTIAGQSPDLVHKLVLVDITPGVNREKAAAIAAFVNGPESFDSFEDLLARTIEHNPTRTESSLRRGILHNAEQRPDGTWVWRHARHRVFDEQTGEQNRDHSGLWNVVSDLGSREVPTMLVRGMREQSVVDDADEAEFLRRHPTAIVERVIEAGHSVQGDQPLELARLLNAFL
ncbi:MAG: alpha/beta hydrolase [Acidimicrobiales bacterium]|nr:alpha/beta hydrolase [Acidimicrobiales bacterium]RZV45556.1 MAG: alpha/beta hydrolase [Acidimicrobiales bacterium]